MFLTKQASEIGARVIAAWNDPAILPAATARIFIRKLSGDARPCDEWSIRNQILIALSGTCDARGFKQWKAAGRHVNKGAKAIYILAPMIAKVRDTAGSDGGDGDTDRGAKVLRGFRGVPVFAVEDTGGAALAAPAYDFDVAALPLIEVALSWGLKVIAADGETLAEQKGAAAWFRPGKCHQIGADGFIEYEDRPGVICMGVTSPFTFFHELIHAADHKIGNLVERGQHFRSETVAEFGACILSNMIGRPDLCEMARAREYVERYATAAGVPLARACFDVMDRTCAAVAEIVAAAGASVTLTTARAAADDTAESAGDAAGVTDASDGSPATGSQLVIA